MRKFGLELIYWIIVFLLISTSSPLSSQSAEERATCVRFGCTPEQARRVFATLDSQKELIERLARENEVSENLLRAIALELDIRNPGLSARQYIQLIEAKAVEAGKLKTQIANLKELVRLLNDENLRLPASGALERAEQALEAGDFQRASLELAKLRELRTSELETAQSAWLEAARAGARVAHLQDNQEERHRILSEAREFTILRGQRALRDQWLLLRDQAEYLYHDGHLKGDNSALGRAILTIRFETLPLVPRDRSPLEWAETQSRLGAVLRILGERESGTQKLEEARSAYDLTLSEITQEHVPIQWAHSENGRANVLQAIANKTGESTLLFEAVQAYRAILTVLTRENAPADWASVQNNLANALLGIGRSSGSSEYLDEAVSAYRLALEINTRSRSPLDWGQSQNGLGNALLSLGRRERGVGRLNEAVAAYRLALEELTREQVPLEWGQSQSNLGNALVAIGERGDDAAALRQAVSSYRMALEVRTRDLAPIAWAETQNGLGNALELLAGQSNDAKKLEQAIRAYERSLEVLSFENQPVDWASSQTNLGNALEALAVMEDDSDGLERAVTAYQSALMVFTKEEVPLNWAGITLNIASVLTKIADHTHDAAPLTSACQLVSETQSVISDSNHFGLRSWAESVLGTMIEVRNKHSWSIQRNECWR